MWGEVEDETANDGYGDLLGSDSVTTPLKKV